MFCLTRKKYTHIEEKYKRIRKKNPDWGPSYEMEDGAQTFTN